MHVAAPVELTVALPGSCELVCVIASSAAHQVAAVVTCRNKNRFRQNLEFAVLSKYMKQKYKFTALDGK
jgi:hypothetical protein